ncbi:MAG: hypothetical protein EXS16_21360 [Gemmataceae bacterium]|nr:hypothetical protein [Gemmataceae bacterium]
MRISQSRDQAVEEVVDIAFRLSKSTVVFLAALFFIAFGIQRGVVWAFRDLNVGPVVTVSSADDVQFELQFRSLAEGRGNCIHLIRPSAYAAYVVTLGADLFSWMWRNYEHHGDWVLVSTRPSGVRTTIAFSMRPRASDIEFR